VIHTNVWRGRQGPRPYRFEKRPVTVLANDTNKTPCAIRRAARCCSTFPQRRKAEDEDNPCEFNVIV
jgi:hypothetical protein